MSYKVGDKVKVREWDDMLKEFGTKEDDSIHTPWYSFTQFMKTYCGKHATIISHYIENGHDYYNIEIESIPSTCKEESAYSIVEIFCFTDEMLESENKEESNDDSPMLLGFDIYNFVKEFSKKNLTCSDSMTDDECAACEFGKSQVLNLLKQVLNEFFKEDNSAVPTYIIHVPGLNTATDFTSIDEIHEKFGEESV